MDATTEEKIEELRNDEEVLSLLCHCGETSILKVSTAISIGNNMCLVKYSDMYYIVTPHTSKPFVIDFNRQ